MPALLALRTQQILAHETGVANTVDPVGGSYAIEWLTDEIERRARQSIERIDALGGMLRAIETGYVQREIQKVGLRISANRRNAASAVVVGVNRFRAERGSADPHAAHRSRRSNASRSSACTLCECGVRLRRSPRRSPKSNPAHVRAKI